jgi:hypothetical protein
MNKKEQAYIEELHTRLALRWTGPVEKDVPPPIWKPGVFNELLKGFTFNSYSLAVNESCSSSIHHSTHDSTKTTTQGAIHMFSSRMLALKAMRHQVEKECASRLRQIDKMIEKEEIESNQ